MGEGPILEQKGGDGMDALLKAIPDAAKSPLALAAYCVCAILFVYGGVRLRLVGLILRQSRAGGREPTPAELTTIVELATETKLPSKVSGGQWVRIKRIQAVVAIVVAALIAIVAITAIAFGESPPPPPPPVKAWHDKDEAGGPYIQSFDYRGPDCHNKPAKDVDMRFWLSRADARIDRVEQGKVEGPVNFDSNPDDGSYNPWIEIAADKKSFRIRRHHTSAETHYEYAAHYSVLR
jgi:hypothetical protein